MWKKCYEFLIPGGRLVCILGDIFLSTKKNKGRHTVIPLHASIQEQCCEIGFDNLALIIWYKIANMQTEATGAGSYLGKPSDPSGIVKNDIEYILMLRKPGGYKHPSEQVRLLSLLSAEEHDAWFRQAWTGLSRASTKNQPAPYPEEPAIVLSGCSVSQEIRS